MFRTYKYRLYPTKAQETTLRLWLKITCGLYNDALQERRDAYSKQKKSISYNDQQNQLTEIMKFDASLKDLSVVMLRGALRRIDRAFKAFFRRCKSGGKVGYPRFKSLRRWDSLCFDDLQKIYPIVCNRIKVPNLGKVKAKVHRPLEGTPKTLTLKLKAGRWYACIGCDEVPTKPLEPTDSVIGIDLGLISYIAMSNDEKEPNPKPLAAARIQLERAHRQVSRRQNGSNRRRKAVALLAKHHARVANVRREFQIKLARSLVKRYGTIYIEALNIKGLSNGRLAKHVRDAAWGSFIQWLRCKAESAGRSVIEVDPRGTSQRCSQCDNVVEKKLSERIHSCTNCGLILDRDVNAARNILRAGLALQGEAAAVSAPRRSVKSV